MHQVSAPSNVTNQEQLEQLQAQPGGGLGMSPIPAAPGHLAGLGGFLPAPSLGVSLGPVPSVASTSVSANGAAFPATSQPLPDSSPSASQPQLPAGMAAGMQLPSAPLQPGSSPFGRAVSSAAAPGLQGMLDGSFGETGTEGLAGGQSISGGFDDFKMDLLGMPTAPSDFMVDDDLWEQYMATSPGAPA